MRKASFFLISFILFFFLSKNSFAAESTSDNQFITIVNPVRISKYTKDIKSNFEAQYQETRKRNLPATWLLTYDVLENKDMNSVLSSIDENQELGIFLEVTPEFATKAGIEYNKTDSWHRAHAVFLSGYTQENRIKLIGTVFEKFKEIFGFYPKSVGAWWIDSYSLDYMQQKYGIVANLGLADQFFTDGYQVWGQFWSAPFIPSKFHAGIPASNLDNKLDIITIEWASRDPLNGYGTVPANNYSTQDYLTINLTHEYFSKLVDIYSSKNLNQFGHITIGLETDLGPSAYHDFYAKQLDIAKTKKVKFLTMKDFANWYLSNYQITPSQAIVTDDLLESEKKIIWYQSPHYRLGLSYDSKENKAEIFDFRVYPEDFQEPNYLSPNKQLYLFIALPSVIDKANDSNSGWIISKNKLTDFVRQGDDLIIRFGDQVIKFSKNSISLNKINTIPKNFKTSPLLSVSYEASDITITPQTKYFIPKDGLIFRGLSIDAKYFLKRPKVQILIKLTVVAILVVLVLLIRLRLNKRLKLILISAFFGSMTVGGSILYYQNNQLYEVSQSEVDALLHLRALPKGKVIVYDDGCLICAYHTKYPPPFFGNNREYVQSISKKPIVYNLKIFKTESRIEGRRELKRVGAKYIYVTKFEDYQEIVPFSPGDYFLDLVYENANAQIWKVRDNAPL